MSKEFDCPVCKGVGVIEYLDGRTWGGDEITHTETCKRCDGEGELDLECFEIDELIALVLEQDKTITTILNRLHTGRW